MKLVVTGATGYLGRAFVEEAMAQGHDVFALIRSKPDKALPCRFAMPSGWHHPELLAKAMEGRDALVHLAGLAHGKAGDMFAANTSLTETLAQAAVIARLPHMVFISSAAVFGQPGHFAVTDIPHPATLYGRSKWEAEKILYRLAEEQNDTKLTVIRPPMVVGTNAPGHAAVLRRLFEKHCPLPLGALKNQRSYVDMDFLVQSLLAAISIQPASSSLRHISQQPVTATELIRRIADADGLDANLWPVPTFMLKPLMAIPALRARLAPLLTDHVLLSGQIALD